MRTHSFGWVFMLAATLILILGFGVVWWAAILVILLASCDFTITTS